MNPPAAADPRLAAAPPRHVPSAAAAAGAARGHGGGAGRRSPWDDANLVERLRELWAQTDPVLTTAEIARRLGHGLRKNAVIGKAHRLGLEPRPSPLRRGPWGHRPATAADSPFVGKARRRGGGRRSGADDADSRSAPRERPAPVALTTFAPPDDTPAAGDAPPRPPAPAPAAASCRWPLGDPKRAGFRFCGAPDVVAGRPYCAAHCAAAYVPADRRAAHLRDQARAAPERFGGGGVGGGGRGGR